MLPEPLIFLPVQVVRVRNSGPVLLCTWPAPGVSGCGRAAGGCGRCEGCGGYVLRGWWADPAGLTSGRAGCRARSNRRPSFEISKFRVTRAQQGIYSSGSGSSSQAEFEPDRPLAAAAAAGNANAAAAAAPTFHFHVAALAGERRQQEKP